MSDFSFDTSKAYEKAASGQKFEFNVDDTYRKVKEATTFQGVSVQPWELDIINKSLSTAPNPDDDVWKWASAIQFSRIHNKPITETMQNLDSYIYGFFGASMPPKTAARAVVDQFHMANVAREINDLGRRAQKEGGLTPELTQELAFLRREMEKYADNVDDRNIFIESLKAGVNNYPQIVRAVGLSIAGAAVAPVAGAMGLAVTPALMKGVAAASKLYSAVDMGLGSVGHEYLRLIENGADNDVATIGAAISGALTGIINTALGADAMVRGLATGVSGGLANAISQKVFAKGVVPTIILRHFTRTAVSTLEEGLIVEPLDALASSLTDIIAAEYMEHFRGKEIDRPGTERIVRDMLEASKGAFLATPWFSVVSGPMGVASDYKALSGLQQYAKASDRQTFIKNAKETEVVKEVLGQLDPQEQEKALNDLWEREQKKTSLEAEQNKPLDAKYVSGHLHTRDVRINESDDGSVEAQFLIGDPETGRPTGKLGYEIQVDSKGNRQLLLKDANFSDAYAGVSSEALMELAASHAGIPIIANEASSAMARALVEKATKMNPRGIEHGAQWFNQSGDEGTQRFRARAIDMFPDASRLQIELETARLETRAAAEGLTVQQFLDKYMESELFVRDDAKLQDAWTKAQATGEVEGTSARAGFYVDPDSGRGLILLSKSSNSLSLHHEMLHMYRRTTIGTEAGKKLDQAYGVSGGVWTRAQEEQLVNDVMTWEAYGTVQHEGLRGIFEQIGKYIVRMWKALSSENKVSPELAAIFDEWLGSQSSPLSAINQEMQQEAKQAEQTIQESPTDETVTQQPVPPSMKGTALPVEWVSPDSIFVDNEVIPQFKKNANKRGVVKQLPGKSYRTEPANPILVWERASDGKRIIATGRHRADLAQRVGAPQVPVQVFKESDGYTVDQMLILDAEQNILDNQGTEQDFAHFFRHTSYTEEAAQENGLLRNDKGRAGWVIARYAGDSLYGLFMMGEIRADKAAAIAEASRGDEALQAVGIRKHREMTADKLLVFIDMVRASMVQRSQQQRDDSAQTDLDGFASDESYQEMIRQNEILSELLADKLYDLTRMKTTLTGALTLSKADRAKIAKEYGLNIPVDAENVGDVQGKIDEILSEIERLKGWATDPEIIRQLRVEAGLPVSDIVVEEETASQDTDTPMMFEPETEDDFRQLRQKWASEGVTLDIYPGKNSASVTIKVNKELRGKGLATAAMMEAGALADKHGIQLELTPTSEWGSSKARLVEFYKRFGFVENKGKHKDFRVSESMYRPVARVMFEADDLFDERTLSDVAVKKFGTTTNPKEAGYILSDGRMLNFSGKDIGMGTTSDYQGGIRMLQHGAVASIEGISKKDPSQDFMKKTGAVRVDFNAGVAYSLGVPSFDAAAIIAANAKGSFTLHIDGPDGQLVGRKTLNSATPYDVAKFYDNPTKPETASLFDEADLPPRKQKDQFLLFEPAGDIGSDKFKAFYDGSKIIDGNGNPVEVYHGTGSVIEEFSLGIAQDKEGRKRNLGMGKGKIYLTGEKAVASAFAMAATERNLGKTPNVMPLYASIKNPIMEKDYYSRFKELSGKDLFDSSVEMKTRDSFIDKLDKQLKSEGVDGIIEIHPDGSFGQIAAFYPTQIKSVNNYGTWDTSDPRILFEYAGENAVLTDEERSALAQAKQMLASGVDGEEIRQKTGWFQGKYDGVWRTEVPSGEIIPRDEIESWGTREDMKQGNKTFDTVGGVYRNPELFKAYPGIDRIGLTLLPDTENGWLQDNPYGMPSIGVGYSRKTGEINKNTLVHELQHAIQKVQGFARGSTPEMQRKMQDENAASYRFYSDQMSKAKKDGDKELYRKLYELRAKVPAPQDPFQAYTKTAGEIEARDAASRMGFSRDQRKSIRPYSSEDIAADEAIILFEPEDITPEAQEAFNAAIETFGTTRDVYEAGYVLPDGTMLDFSGRHEATGYQKKNGMFVVDKGRDYLKHERATDHREIDWPGAPEGRNDSMEAFIDMGAIRMDANSGLADMSRMPTTKQWSVIKTIIQGSGTSWVEMRDGKRTATIEADGNPAKALGYIRRFYDGQDFDSTIMFEAGDPEFDRWSEGHKVVDDSSYKNLQSILSIAQESDLNASGYYRETTNSEISVLGALNHLKGWYNRSLEKHQQNAVAYKTDDTLERTLQWMKTKGISEQSATEQDRELAMDLGYWIPSDRTVSEQIEYHKTEAVYEAKEASDLVQKISGIDQLIEKASNTFQTGEPVVAKVFHGTGRNVDQFDSFREDLRGSFTGARSAKIAFFFGGNINTAHAYVPDTGQNTEWYNRLVADGNAKGASDEAVDRLQRYVDAYLEMGTVLNDALTQIQAEIDALGPTHPDTKFLDRLDDKRRKLVGEIQDHYTEFPSIETTKRIAEYAGLDDFDPAPPAGGVLELWLKLDNPKVIDWGGGAWHQAADGVTGRWFEAVKAARDEGHDGIILMNARDGGPTDNIFAKFSSYGIKDASGRNVTFDETNRIYFEADDGWIYKAEETISQKLKGPMPGNSILKMLQNAGVKAEELKWTGLDKFLDTDEKLTPAQVMEHIQGNRLQIEEVEKGWNSERARRKLTKDILDKKWEIGQTTDPVEMERLRGELDHLNKQALAMPLPNPPKFSQYTLPGGENYREVLFKLPVKVGELKPFPEFDVWAKENLNEIGLADEKFAREGYEIAKKEQYNDAYSDAYNRQYQSGHWDERNVLAHTRLNDRVTSDGKKALFIEEIQSDLHQEGKKKGYSTEVNIKIVESQDDPGYWFAEDDPGKLFTSKEVAEKSVEKRINGLMTPGVPDSPFKKTWHEFVFKRILREAVEKGYDTVSWTPGAVQFDRWGSEEIAWKREGEGWKVAVTEQRGGVAGGVDIEADARRRGELLEVSGKSVNSKEALQGIVRNILSREHSDEQISKIVDRTWTRMQTEDEGSSMPRKEGMEGFYDKMLVDYANSFGKKYGAQVADSELPMQGWMLVETGTPDEGRRIGSDVFDSEAEAERFAENSRMTYYSAEPVESQTVHSMPITPAMTMIAEKGTYLFEAVEQASLTVQDELYSRGLEYSVQYSRSSLSRYYKVNGEYLVRVSDHPSPPAGGYYGKADINYDVKDPESARVFTEWADTIGGKPRFSGEQWFAPEGMTEATPKTLFEPEDSEPDAYTQNRGKFASQLSEGKNLEAFLSDLWERIKAENDPETKGKTSIEKMLANHPFVLGAVISHGKKGQPLNSTVRRAVLSSIRKSELAFKEMSSELTGDLDLAQEVRVEKEAVTGPRDIKLPRAYKGMTVAQRQAVLDNIRDKNLKEKIENDTITEPEIKEYIERLESDRKKLADREKSLDTSKLKGQALAEALKSAREESKLAAKEIRAMYKLKEVRAKLVANILEPIRKGAKIDYEQKTQLRAIKDYLRNKKWETERTEAGGYRKTGRIVEPPLNWSKISQLFREHPGLENILTQNLVNKINDKPLKDWTYSELLRLNKAMEAIYAAGRTSWQVKENVRNMAIYNHRDEVERGLKANPKYKDQNAPGSAEERKILKGLNSKYGLILGTMNSERFIEYVLDKKNPDKPNWTLLVDEHEKHYKERLRQTERRANPVLAYMKAHNITADKLTRKIKVEGAFFNGKDVHYTADDIMMFVAGARNEKSRDALLGMLLDEVNEKKFLYDSKTLRAIAEPRLHAVLKAAETELTADEKGLMELIAKDYATEFPRLNKEIIRLTNEELRQEENYIPMLRMGLTQNVTESVVNDILTRNASADGSTSYMKASPENGWAKERINIGLTNQAPIRLGLFKTWMEATHAQEQLIAMGEYVDRLNRVYKGHGAEKIRTMIKNMAGDSGLKVVDNHIHNIAHTRAVEMFGRQGADVSDQLLRRARGFVAVSALSWRLASALNNLMTTPWPYLAYAPGQLFGTAADMMRNPTVWMEETKALSITLRNYNPDPLWQQIKRMDPEGYEKVVKKIGEVGMKGLEFSQTWMVALGWRAVYNKEMAKHGNQEQAIERADYVTRHCQPSARAIDMAPLFQDTHEWKRAFTQFGSQLNVVFQQMAFDMPHALSEKNYSEFFGIAAGMVVSGMALGVIRKGFGRDKRKEDDDQWWQDWMFYAISQPFASLPLVSGPVSQAVKSLVTKRPYYKSGSGMYPVIESMISSGYNLVSGNTGKGMTEAAVTLARISGLPILAVQEYLQYLQDALGEE
jgi:GNAT superfamily N-acetyltransferase